MCRRVGVGGRGGWERDEIVEERTKIRGGGGGGGGGGVEADKERLTERKKGRNNETED